MRSVTPLVAYLLTIILGGCYHKEEIEVIKRCVNGHHYEIYRNGKNSLIIEKHDTAGRGCNAGDSCQIKNG